MRFLLMRLRLLDFLIKIYNKKNKSNPQLELNCNLK